MNTKSYLLNLWDHVSLKIFKNSFLGCPIIFWRLFWVSKLSSTKMFPEILMLELKERKEAPKQAQSQQNYMLSTPRYWYQNQFHKLTAVWGYLSNVYCFFGGSRYYQWMLSWNRSCHKKMVDFRETWLKWDITVIWLRICLLRISKSLHLKHMAPKGDLLFMYMYFICINQLLCALQFTVWLHLEW